MTTGEGDGIQAEVEAAVRAAMAAKPRSPINKAEIIRPFLDGGEVSRPTLYRWVGAVVERVKAEAEEAARPKPKPPKAKREVAPGVRADADPATALAALVPAMETMEATVAGPGGQGSVQVTAMLRSVVENVNMLMTHAKTPEGAVRNARLLLQSTDALRRCLETSIRVFQAMREVEQVDRLHAALIEEVMKESPETAERMLRRMDAIAASWGG